MNRLLTDEEMRQAMQDVYYKTDVCRAIAKAQDAKTHRLDVESLEEYVFYMDAMGYIALKPNATKNWQTFRLEGLVK